ncbi:MAG: DNA-processing protein DprA [Lachnospiraceae bacterium]|jgi:DNA processing protein|nr:DNA-processing protein DprA [Lachnospiraceae bacterium]
MNGDAGNIENLHVANAGAGKDVAGKATIGCEDIDAIIFWLSATPGVGAAAIRRICTLDTPGRILRMGGQEFFACCLGSKAQWQAIQAARPYFGAAEAELGRLNGMGVSFVTFLDARYPQRLSVLPDAPAGLYVKGALPADGVASCAVVGARLCSPYGRQVAYRLGEILGKSKVQVVSGLASGIDVAAHRGAIAAGGDTFGILGCGVDLCYPRENFNTYYQMQRQGGVISEFPMGTKPLAQLFPVRNRIISALADILVVVEAKEKSGSFITVEHALGQGKEVFAVPGRLSDPLSLGCNRLIQMGANILTDLWEIPEYLGISGKKKPALREKSANTLAKAEKMLYSCMDLQPKSTGALIEESGLGVPDAMSALFSLEMEGYVECVSGGYARTLRR